MKKRIIIVSVFTLSLIFMFTNIAFCIDAFLDIPEFQLRVIISTDDDVEFEARWRKVGGIFHGNGRAIGLGLFLRQSYRYRLGKL